MKIAFLGTNGWYDSPTGNTVCVLVEGENETVILDAGSGLWKLDRFIDLEKPAFLFLSHFHLDHTIGLHILAKFAFHNTLTICGPPGIEEALTRLVAAPYTASFSQLPFAVRLCLMPDDVSSVPFPVTALPLAHVSPCMGYRLVLDGKTVTYCSDTGYCGNAVTLARKADLLITDCAYRTGQESVSWPHLNPESAARIAREAGVQRLALVHFDAALYPTLQDRECAQTDAARHFPDVVAACDDMVIEM